MNDDTAQRHSPPNRSRARPRPAPKRLSSKRLDPPGAAGAPSPEACIFGLHAAAFALANPSRRITAIYATDNARRRLADELAPHEALIQTTSPRDLDRRLGPETVHQGILLEVEPLPSADLEAAARRAHETGFPVIVLDQVTDPHNVGAVLRSAAVFGAAGLVMTQRHSPPLGGALAKAASGALELTPVALVRNLAEAIAALKAEGLVVIGLDGAGDQRLEQAVADLGGRPMALALGAEGKGLRALTRSSCDRLCRIGGDGPIQSLNVSNAAAVALHVTSVDRLGRGNAA